MNYSANLNKEQLEAVNTIEGPVLVLAGAGSGKTRVVTARMATLIDMGVPASQILGLTFTNKAAQEMRERVHMMVGKNALLVCTFHSLGARILRESIAALGYTRDFTIYDDDDTDKLLQTVLSELEIKDKKLDVRSFKSLISRAKNALQMPEDIKTSMTDTPIETLFPRVYELYQTKLKMYNAVDFDDLLFLVVRLFKEHPAILNVYQERFSFLLIDEYQDTNAAQYTILMYLVAKHYNIFAVGDPDQSIYSWRGANIHNILNFEKDFSNAKIIKLEQNYRSHTNILQAANALIQHNDNRYEKALWSELGEGEKIKFYVSDNEREEAEFVAERIKKHHENGVSYSEMVVFYRTNNQSRTFEDCFLYKRLPYVIVGGLSFYQRREIKDILSFMRMIYSGTDYISFARSINIPKRGIGEATLEKIRTNAGLENMSILGYAQALIKGLPLSYPTKLPAKQKEGLQNYLNIIEELRNFSEKALLSDIVKKTIEATNYLSVLNLDPESYEDRKGNLDALITKAIEWEQDTTDNSLRAFLEELTLKSSLDEADTKKDKVNLMTIHNGKGLEFKVTFLVGLEEDLFPHVNSKDSLSALEEERRLCYVGMTRAKEQLYLSFSRFRYMWGMQKYQQESRFIKEVPSKYIEHVKKAFARKYVSSEVEEVDQKDIEELENEPFYTYDVGSAVFHKDFGIGVIKDTSSSSLGLTYKIFFSKDKRERSIVAKYAKLKKL